MCPQRIDVHIISPAACSPAELVRLLETERRRLEIARARIADLESLLRTPGRRRISQHLSPQAVAMVADDTAAAARSISSRGVDDERHDSSAHDDHYDDHDGDVDGDGVLSGRPGRSQTDDDEDMASEHIARERGVTQSALMTLAALFGGDTSSSRGTRINIKHTQTQVKCKLQIQIISSRLLIVVWVVSHPVSRCV